MGRSVRSFACVCCASLVSSCDGFDVVVACDGFGNVTAHIARRSEIECDRWLGPLRQRGVRARRSGVLADSSVLVALIRPPHNTRQFAPVCIR